MYERLLFRMSLCISDPYPCDLYGCVFLLRRWPLSHSRAQPPLPLKKTRAKIRGAYGKDAIAESLAPLPPSATPHRFRPRRPLRPGPVVSYARVHLRCILGAT